MIVQDSQTGAYHELPDHLSGYAGYGDQLVYDGLGNPVGRLAGIFDDIGSAIRGVVSNIPVVGPMLSNILPGGGAGPPVPPTPPVPMPFPQLPTPQLPVSFAQPPIPLPSMGGGFPAFRPSWPTGWVRPPLPYTGLGPRRLYMRCAVWPGPRGLVPGYAQNLPPQLPPGVPPPGLPSMGGRRHHRRHHRR